jgi:hypothetical protein
MRREEGGGRRKEEGGKRKEEARRWAVTIWGAIRESEVCIVSQQGAVRK